MSVRRRKWKSNGEVKEKWVVNYSDQEGKRRLKTFDRKCDANDYHTTVAIDIKNGIHTPDSASVTVAKAGELWLAECEAAKLECSTLRSYKSTLRKHIIPLIGAVKLSVLTAPHIRAFKNQLRTSGRSPATVRKTITFLGFILDDAQDCGLVAQNVVRNRRKKKRYDRDQDDHKRRQGQLKIGVDIPSLEEITKIIPHLQGRWRPLLLTAIFTGLRASELRGLTWPNIDLTRGELHVRQRADITCVLGPPKSAAGERAVPLPPILVNTLREWKLVCPRTELEIVFPVQTPWTSRRVGQRGIQARETIVRHGWQPAQIAAGVVNEQGKAKYRGLHCLRHFYASWCINRRVDGGLELPLKVVQTRLGHASIKMTADVYGHLFPAVDDSKELAAAEKRFFDVVPEAS